MQCMQAQPYLHELITTVRAPALALSGSDGQIRPLGASGVYVSDRRVLSCLILNVDQAEPMVIRGQSVDADTARFNYVVPGLGDPGPDPTVHIERTRQMSAEGLTETIEIQSRAREPISCTVTLTLASDYADMSVVKSGRPTFPVKAERSGPAALRWRGNGGVTTIVSASPEPSETDLRAGTFLWQLELASSERILLTLTVATSAPGATAVALPPSRPRSFREPAVIGGDHRLAQLIRHSAADLDALRMADPQDPTDNFLGAGAPWYLTLFGRDSIWAARMLLPWGTDIAAGTLRTLARRQGRRTDPATAEQPGKILHEIRPTQTDFGDWTHASSEEHRLVLPPLYYGTVDATALWISLLHDAWRWGMPTNEVQGLLPALELALTWLADHSLDERGFLSYSDPSGHGLANQGWKDSVDAVQFSDGVLAKAPIALAEAQAYAFAAAVHGSALLSAFGRAGAADWTTWAADLQTRFRTHFWVPDREGAYPAIALDGDGRQVDTVTSNIGHLLGTGLLSNDEEALVALRLLTPEMDSGFGIRTLSARSRGFNPLGYHTGSVWTHDTAIALSGLAVTPTAPATDGARRLLLGLLDAAPAFDYRMPELFAGVQRMPGVGPLPYPASCRPQAWSAASAAVLLTAILGMRADVPNGAVHFRPLRPSPVGEVTVRGLTVAGRVLDVHVTFDGQLTVLSDAADLNGLVVTID
jgi:glycogen debranching enzyme